MKAVNILTTEKDEIAANFQAIKGQLFNMGELEAGQSRLQEELNVAAKLIQQRVRENAHVAPDQTEYQASFLAGLSETGELPADFNGKLFHRLVGFATVYSDGRVVFTFRNGVEVSTEI